MRTTLTLLAVAGFVFAPTLVHAQASDAELAALRLLSVPVTALPPIALPMPASRNHSYFIGRLQAGVRKGPGGEAMPAIAGGIDFQYRGGSVIGATVGYQKRDCGIVGGDCGGHSMFGVRSQIGLMTGGSIFAGLLNDNSATSTLGTEFGFASAVASPPDQCLRASARNFSPVSLPRICLICLSASEREARVDRSFSSSVSFKTASRAAVFSLSSCSSVGWTLFLTSLRKVSSARSASTTGKVIGTFAVDNSG